MGVSQLGGIDDLLTACFRPAIGDVFPHGGAKQECLLQYKTDLLAKRFHGEVADVGPVDFDFSRKGIVEARHQADEG